MELSDKEKREIYEAEKARIEAEQLRITRKKNLATDRSQRIASSIVAIAWGIVLLVLFYFFRHYLAYYQIEDVNGVATWIRYDFLTADFDRWLIILTITLVFTIAFHIALLVYDRYILRQSVVVILNLFGVATIASLLNLFPFDFATIPDVGKLIFPLLLRVGLVIVLIIMIIVTLVNLIKFIIRLATKTAYY